MGGKSINGGFQPHEVLLETDLLVVVAGKEAPYTVTLTPERIILNSDSRRKCLESSKTKFSLLSRDIVSVRPPLQEGNTKMKKGKYPVFMIVAFHAIKGKT